MQYLVSEIFFNNTTYICKHSQHALYEHVYHVLENNKAQYNSEDIPRDPNALELPPPSQTVSQDTQDTLPIYQDIKMS